MSHRSSFSHVTFRDMMHRARKEAILQECEHLLGEVGYEAMTLEQVAESAGIAKAVLYKHFKGKEDLCCEVMVRGIDRAREFLYALPATHSAHQRLCAFVRWVLQAQIDGDGPFIAERKSHIRHVLRDSEDYCTALASLEDVLDGYVQEAQHDGAVHPAWRPEVARWVLLTRAVDPLLLSLQSHLGYSPQEAVEWCATSTMAALHAEPVAVPQSVAA